MVHHLPEQGLHHRSLGRGVGRRNVAPRDAVPGGADDTARATGGRNDGLQHEGDRGLAVGASDADDGELLARVALHRCCRDGQRSARVLNLHSRHAVARLYRAVRNHCGDIKVRDEISCIHPLAADGDEDISGAGLARVVHDPFDVAIRGACDLGRPKLCGERGEEHGGWGGGQRGLRR